MSLARRTFWTVPDAAAVQQIVHCDLQLSPCKAVDDAFACHELRRVIPRPRSSDTFRFCSGTSEACNQADQSGGNGKNWENSRFVPPPGTRDGTTSPSGEPYPFGPDRGNTAGEEVVFTIAEAPALGLWSAGGALLAVD